MEEKSVNGHYFCGQFNILNKFEGYGFALSNTGVVEQGVFLNGKLNFQKPHLILELSGKYSAFGTIKETYFNGYYHSKQSEGNIFEGYIKNGISHGENINIDQDRTKKFIKNSKSGTSLY